MPSSLKFLYKKGKPKLSKKKNKVWSKAKRKGNRHVDRKMLDNMLSPVYSVTKKDYGYSTVFDDALANVNELPVSGNLSSIQCAPGRQIYLEFAALPVRIFDQAALTGQIAKSTHQRTWAFIDLLYGAYKRNRYLNQQSSEFANPSNFNLNETNYTFNIPLDQTGASTNYQISSSSTTSIRAFVENILPNAAFNFKFQYMGGHQTHKFQNTTTLPIYGEVREFRPRQTMGYDVYLREVDKTDGTVGTKDAIKWPGMWMTLYQDLLRITNKEQDNGQAGGAAYNTIQPGLFDEIDDRNFKFKPGCEETTFRWVVGEAKKFVIYPGETFTYSMILPPFAGDSFQFLKNIQRRWTNDTNSEVNEWGVTPAFVPGFSKFCQFRFIGSRAFTQAARADNDVTNPNYVNDTNNDANPGVNTPYPANNMHRPIAHSATHGCRLTHTCTEHHKMRTFPVYEGRTHIFTDFTANAQSVAEIQNSDEMQFIDPLENNIEGIPGDNMN